MANQPVIKWSGSKRSQAVSIVSNFPNNIDTYYEPFVGGASVLFALLHSDKDVKRYVCSDINKDLITLWEAIKSNPSGLVTSYSTMWNELNCDDNLGRKKQYFYKVRKRFNENRMPQDFLFISRTTTNGLIRYNKKGEFNNSFHVTRKGIRPDSLGAILFSWSQLLNKHSVQFIHCDYKEISPNSADFIYLDPPYAVTKGMYYGTIDYGELWDWLRQTPCSYALSFDGKRGEEDRTHAVPEDVYSKHKYIESGCSSFKRLKKQTTEYVQESLYLR